MSSRVAASSAQEPARLAGDYGVSARYYDAVYGVLAPQDIEFYLELAARGDGAVLELGCGTGRVTLPLARAGYRVTALDLNPSMLAVLRDKLALETAEVRERVQLIEGDMASFSLTDRFALVLQPFRAYQHLLTPEAQRDCLQLVATHLSADGLFVYNAFNPNLTFIVDNLRAGKVWRMDFEGPFEGGTLRRYTLLQYKLYEQVLDLDLKYEQCDPDGRMIATHIEKLVLRWQYRWEVEYLLELCGLSIETALGGFDGSSIEGGKDLIYVCRAASSGEHQPAPAGGK